MAEKKSATQSEIAEMSTASADAQKKTESGKRQPLLIAAIDFGTTYSGTAYSFRHDYVTDPLKIYAREWSGGSLMSAKAPTCVLIRPDGKTLEAFGFDAEDRYAELAADNEHHQYYYFKNFKMLLFDKKDLKRNVMLDDISGKQLHAKTVFGLAIKFLRDDLIQMSEKRTAAGGFRPTDVYWVLTIPAIWNDAAKQFMREAATDKDFAAIPNEMLTIALEPEAASLFCRHLPVQQKQEQEEMSISEFEPGTKYMVVDAGGGTVDVSVHEVKDDNTLKELHKASGGSWGGTKVDQAFSQFNIKLVGNNVWTEFQQNHNEDYLDMFRDWEVKKRKIEPKTNSRLALRMPLSLSQVYKDENGAKLNKVLNSTMFGDKIEFKGDKMRVDVQIIKDFFTQPIENITTHLNDLLQDPHVQGLSTILLVGGFSECKLLQSSIKKRFPNLNIVIPDDAGLAVLKGAVIFGHSPKYVSERVARLTYGINMFGPFLSEKHPPSTKLIVNNNLYCGYIFDKHVVIGQSLKFDEAQSEIKYLPGDDNNTCIRFEVFSSTETSPEYTTDVSCKKLGELRIEGIPSQESGQNRSVLVRMYLGRTELGVEAQMKETGDIKRVFLDCL